MAKKALTTRIALRSEAEYQFVSGQLPDPDPVLRKMGKDITTYRELLSDPRVGSNVENRQSGVLSMLWEVDRGKSKSRIAQFVTDMLGNLDIPTITSEILEAPLFGMKPLEVLWTSDGSRTVPGAIDGLPQEWFVFDHENHLRFKTKDNPTGIDLTTPEYQYKFLLPRYRSTYANPYGVRILSRVFWYVVFKRGGMRFWVTFTEKYGMPWLFGKYRAGATDAEKLALQEGLEALIQDGVGILPEGDGVDKLDVTTSGASAQLYEKLLRYCDEETSIAILGHTGSSQSTPGRLGSEDAALEVRADIIDSDRRLVEQTWDQVIRWAVDINFGAQKQYPRMEFFAEEDVDQEMSERDKNLHDIGVRFKEEYFVETYNLPEGQFTVDNTAPRPAPAVPGQGAEFAAAGQAQGDAAQTAVDTLIDGLPPELLQQQMEELLKPIIDMIKRADSLEEIQTKLAELFPKLDATGLEKTLEKAFLLAETWGRATATEG